MKNFTKLIAAGVALATLATMSGCSLLGLGSKVSPSSLDKICEDDGAKKYESYKEFKSMLEEMSDAENEDGLKKLKKGVYISLEGKDLKKYFDNTGFDTGSTAVSYDKTMKSATTYYIGNVKDDTMYVACALSIEFETSDDAEQYYEDTIEDIEDGIGSTSSGLETDFDDGEENGITYYPATARSQMLGTAIREGVYRDGKYVFFLVGIDTNGSDSAIDKLDSICEELGLVSPSELD